MVALSAVRGEKAWIPIGILRPASGKSTQSSKQTPERDAAKIETWWEDNSQARGSLVERCMRQHGWSEHFAERTLRSYRHFMELKSIASDSLEASSLAAQLPIEQMWEQHIMDKNYNDDCRLLFGRVIGQSKIESSSEVKLIRYEDAPVDLKDRCYIPSNMNQELISSKLLISDIYIFKDEIDPKRLECAMSEVLQYYPAIGGRMVFHGRFQETYINMNNSGAWFKACLQDGGAEEVYAKFQDGCLIRDDYYIPMDPSLVAKGQNPLLSVQLTTLKQGGCTIGLCVSHAVADGGSAALFMSDFSKAYRGLAVEGIANLPESFALGKKSQTRESIQAAANILNFDRFNRVLSRSIVRPIIIANHKASLKALVPVGTRLRLTFSKPELAALKHMSFKTAGPDCPWISTNEALLEYVWLLLLDSCGLSDEKRSALQLSVVVDPRGRTPSIPIRTLGNAPQVNFGTIDLSSGRKRSIIAQLHDFCRRATSQEVVDANITMMDVWFPRKTWDPIYCPKGESLLKPYHMKLWNSKGASFESDKMFDAKLLAVSTCDLGEMAMVSPRPDGGLDVFCNTHTSGNSASHWPLVVKMGKDEYWKQVKARHEAWQARVRAVLSASALK